MSNPTYVLGISDSRPPREGSETSVLEKRDPEHEFVEITLGVYESSKEVVAPSDHHRLDDSGCDASVCTGFGSAPPIYTIF